MGLRDWLRRENEKKNEMMYFYELGCGIMGEPAGGWWRSTLAERTSRIQAGKREHKRRTAGH
ncbi:hypothetical protein C5B93_03435 [Rathayibacter sp. AY1A2]|uniref:hypothetical protein n=1 Tax=Rathayibacter sp. AY1A2 TaxID=2080520 RepID=UPI000CE7276E|nr:hypothetical protein [Rathayibacter sp. AY1A2]PPF40651.1 hypothetical protein C5B93_03435 [Rathayibacter sp. AY1A2]